VRSVSPSRSKGGATPDFAVGIGSNLGNRGYHLRRAAVHLAASPAVSRLRLSGVWETEPRDAVEGGRFYNCAAAGCFSGTPLDLLEVCREAERLAGSPTEKRGAARALDVDILCMEGVVSRGPLLLLPHPRLAARRFVLVPLAEVWPGPIPGIGVPPSLLLRACGDPGEVLPVIGQPPPGALWGARF